MHHGDFGRLLKRHRELAGLTQAELAVRSGVSAAAIRDLEQARSRRPRLRSIAALATALRLNAEEAAAFQRSAVLSFDDKPARQSPAEGVPGLSVLGTLTLHRGENAIGLGAGRHRTVLARLALTPNVAVHRDELVDLLWPQDAPASAVNLVQSYVSKLRRLFEPRQVISLLPGGYRLGLDADDLDLLRFRQWCGDAQNLPAQEAFDRLTRALALWQGPPVHDVAELREHPLVIGLSEERITAALELARLADELGRHKQTLPTLRQLVLAHPLDEPLQAALITALAATGRQAAALAAYDEVRRRLAEELGVDPGQHLRDIHRGVLEHRWPQAAPAAPAAAAAFAPVYQTPAAPPDFVGREAQLRQLVQALDRDPAAPLPQQVAVAAVCGAAGVGKTSLALQTAYQLRGAFPDGQLYLDLQGASPAPVAAADALAQFLRALGLPAAKLPAGEAESAALFRSTLAERRVLVVLDNARDAAQIRPLLPGVGGSAVLVTSRRRMTALAGATVVDLGLFTPAESLALLAAVAGRGRVQAEQGAAAELATLCGQLPIALRVAGGRLASRPNWTISSFALRLDDQRRRLDELRAGDVAVDASFRCSYDELVPAAAAAFRRLAVLPPQRFSTAMAAAALGEPAERAEALLDELVDGNLLQSDSDGRYYFHDLLRLYATRCAEADDAAASQQAAAGRLLDWLLAHCAAAMRRVYPEMVRLPVDVAAAEGIPSQEAALSWLDTHLAVLVAAIDTAADQGFAARAWQLADQLRGYFFLRRITTGWVSSGRTGLAAARAAGDLHGQAAMHQTLGQALWATAQHEPALDEYRQAVALAEQCGWTAGVAYLRHNIGLVQHELGRLAEAQESFRQALDLSRAHGLTHIHAVTLNDLGAMCHDQGRLTEAVEYFTEALRLNQGESRRQSAAANQSNLGMILRQLGDLTAAREHLHASLDWYRQNGFEHGELAVLDELSQLHTQLGEHSSAVVAAKQAVELARITGDRRAEAALLCTLGEATLAAGDVIPARECFAEAEQLAAAHSYPYYRTRARTGAAAVCLAADQLDQAAELSRSALDSARAGGFRQVEAEAMATLARAHLARGDLVTGAELCRQALALATTIGAAALVAQLQRLLDHTDPLG